MKNGKMKPSTQNNKVGRASASAGMTNSAGVTDGLSSHRQIKSGNSKMGMSHGEGERPKSIASTTLTHGGKSFKTK